MPQFLKKHHQFARFGLVVSVFFLFFFAFDIANIFQMAVSAAPKAQSLPEVEFASTASRSVTEANVDIILNVVIDSTPSVTVTVDFTVIDGSALLNSDYTVENITSVDRTETLTFPPGVSANQTIKVTILEDTFDEPDETFFLVLQDVTNGTLGARSTAQIVILDDDASVPTSTPDPSDIIFADLFEPNDNFNQAKDVTNICQNNDYRLTLWPIGDVDYFRFVAKAGNEYTVETYDLDDGIDTVLSVFGPNLNTIGTNDDIDPPDKASSVTIMASQDGFYYAQVSNRDPTDPTDKTYCLRVVESTPATPAPFPTPADECEFNSTIEFACLLIPGAANEIDANFLPTLGSARDTDIYRVFVKPGLLYTCETEIPSDSPADTNIILLDGNGNNFNPNIGNDDKSLGDFGSRVSYLATYTGWLYVVVGPRITPDIEEAALHKYTIFCLQSASTPTPTPRPTLPPSSGGGTGTVPTATATSIGFPSPVPTATPIDFSFLTPVVPTPPIIIIDPLPTPTAVAGSGQNINISVTLYYDENSNNTIELNEGITDAAVALYDNLTGQLIAFGYSNETGRVQFSGILASGAVRVVVPFLNYQQIVAGTNSDIIIRVAPQPLPGGIP